MIFMCASRIMVQQIAFPTAEGYGKYSAGGRSGDVYEVTTLNGSGAGSLGEAINASGPRTVVFKVAGTIEGDFKISNDNLTIAGQTAPGDGICIKGSISIKANDLIIRYIRIRPNASGDALTGGSGCNRVILDHVSCSWSADEVLSVYGGKNTRFQYCLISEPCGNGYNFVNNCI
jgi:pectate lyase